MRDLKTNADKIIARKKYCWMLIYFLLGSGIPLVLFFYDFYYSRPSNISKNDYNEFIFDVIRTYSPLFIYACIGGFLLPCYIIPAYEYFKSTVLDKKVVKIRRTLLKAALAVAILVAVADFFGGAPAIWEVKPPYHGPYIAHFISADMKTTDTAKRSYAIGLESVLSHGMINWSTTRYSYIFSVLIEAFFLNAFFYLSFLYYAFRKTLKSGNPKLFHEILNGLIISSLLIFIWLLLRDMNSMEKAKLYPGAPLQDTNIAVGLLNIICLFTITITRLSDEKMRKAANDVVNVLYALGLTSLSILALFKPEILVLFFGKKADLINYIVFPIVFLLLYAAYYIVNLGAQVEEANRTQEA